MEFANLNPCFLKHQKLLNKKSVLSQALDDVHYKVMWYESFKLKENLFSLDSLNAEIKIQEEKLHFLEKEMQKKTRRSKLAESAGEINFLEPFGIFSTQRMKYHGLYERLKEQIFNLNCDIQELAIDINAKKQNINTIVHELNQYHKTSVASENENKLNLEKEIDRLDKKIIINNEKLELIEKIIVEPKNKLIEMFNKKKRLENDIVQANEFKMRLGNAHSPYARKLIHDECNNYFDCSSPNVIIKNKKRECESISGNMKKLESRIRGLINTSMFEISTVIIDGNNLCYEQSNFIGLLALKPLVKKLSEKYKVELIFDSGIQGLLNKSNKEIADLFFGVAKVYIVNSSRTADETILDQADGDDRFIISNDKFHDFPEKSAYKERRIINHEIIGNKVRIRNLQIEVIF
ncbi:hypothetical protein [Providencia stuartii]|uniref:hypothetical protein n=1 Tax=Providencia stuartii TaxID=588 RepID=UPI002883A75D|nr:hypothetical protein [Providencia stuartii]MDT1065162.1 hypothetical protein [Providencia stuartii]